MVFGVCGTLLVGGLLAPQVRAPVHLRVVHRIETARPCSRLVLSADGRVMAGWSREGVFWMDTREDRDLRPAYLHGTPLLGRTDTELMVLGDGWKWYDRETGKVSDQGIEIIEADHRADVLWAVPGADPSTWLVHARVERALGNFQGNLYRWNPDRGALQLVTEHFGFVEDFARSPDGIHAVAAVEYGRICGNAPRAGALHWMDLETGHSVRIATSGPGLGVDFSKDGSRLLWADLGGIHEITTDDMEFVREVRCSVRFLQRIRNRYALTHDGLSVFLWDLRRLEPVCRWQFDEAEPSHQLMRPRRARLRDGAVYPPRPPPTGVHPFQQEAATIQDMAVSADGSMCAIAGEAQLVVFRVVGG